MGKKYKGIYYFYFEYYVYVNINNTSALILNTLDNQMIICSDERVVNLIRKIQTKTNHIIEIDFDKEHSEDIYQSFFNNIRKKYMGDLIEKSDCKSEPINYDYNTNPIINNDFRKESIHLNFGFDKIEKSVFNINIYLNNDCFCKCNRCNSYYRQFNNCSKLIDGDGAQSIDVKSIENILSYSSFDNLNIINILGGNVSLYNDLDSILNLLQCYKDKCFVYFNYFNIRHLDERIKSFFENRIIITVDLSMIDQNDIDILINKYNIYNIDLIISEIGQIKKMMKLTESLHSYQIRPFFNGKNTSFFRKNVFLNKKDIFDNRITLNQIHRNKFINTLFFGDLTIFPNSEVYTNVNEESIGNLKNESFSEIIFKCLMDKNSIWFRTRNKTSCSKCLFTDLCPPISNYELILKRNNLCNV